MAKEPRSDLPPRPDEEIAAPDPDARKEFDSRPNYKGFKMPKGMSLPQRRAYKKAIDEREVLFRRNPPVDEFGNEIIGAPRNPTALQRKAKRYSEQVIGPTFEDLKQTATELPGKIGRGAKAVGEGLIDAATVVPRTKAAIAADPAGAKQFARNVMSGDREAIRSMATEASGGIVEPLATVGDAVLGGMAAQEGKPLEAAGYAGLILTPAILQTLGKSMSKGWLKSAAEAGEEIPDEAARKLDDLSKRVDAGEVTDDMQIRREIAMVEDTYKRDYAQSLLDKDPILTELTREQDRLTKQIRDAENFTDERGNPFQGQADNLLIELEMVEDKIRSRVKRRNLIGSPEDLAMERRQDVYEGITTDMRGTPGGGGNFKIGTWDDQYRKSGYTQAHHDRYNFLKKAEDDAFDKLEREGFEPGSQAEDDFFQSMFDEKMSDELLELEMIRGAERRGQRGRGDVAPSGGGRSIDDLEGPSEAEIRQMVEQGRFGDPEELEMLKEDMRRMAQLEQGAQIGRGRARQSRSPGTPGVSGEIPEGTSRADRKGTIRERPKPKKN
jgi:hypothetical protein